jgi:deoxyribodipyrimidine photo-lyase
LQHGGPEPPVAAPAVIPAPRRWPRSRKLAALDLQPAVDWAVGIRAQWQPGESAAEGRLQRFLDAPIDDYPANRDRPDLAGTSQLSPYLHFGEISARRVWAALEAHRSARGRRTTAVARYRSELGWREFAHHLLFHFPHTAALPLRREFINFPWSTNRRHLRAWQRGKTGFPIVDAGMRELWHTGWMHNRVRMIAASFLVKDLMIDWRQGAAWFWDTLVDADLANNTLNWQWVSGCGADAAPYFRIFNPVAQGEKFDSRGDYVRQWVPELAALPVRWIHKPWQAPQSVLASAGIVLGKNYPRPLVDHAAARSRALAAFQEIKQR